MSCIQRPTLSLPPHRSTLDFVVFIVLITILVVILAIGMMYTAQNCRKLARAIRGDDDEGVATRRLMDENANEITQKLRTSSKRSHQQLGHELQSMQQLQLDVASQLVEIKSVLSQYAAIQHQQRENDEYDKQD